MILWQNDIYHGIIKFDGRIIYLRKSEDGGTYFTILPISEKEYRKKHPTKACVRMSQEGVKIRFEITDDWGDNYFLYISTDMENQIEKAKKAIIAENLLLED